MSILWMQNRLLDHLEEFGLSRRHLDTLTWNALLGEQFLSYYTALLSLSKKQLLYMESGVLYAVLWSLISGFVTLMKHELTDMCRVLKTRLRVTHKLHSES
jgi:hypothetical protein